MTLIEQKQIAKMLGMSGNKFISIVSLMNLEYTLINNFRHYDYEKVLEKIAEESRKHSRY